MKKAAAYIRVSTDDQTEYSPDSQIKLIRQFAKKNGYVISSDLIFNDEAISGKDAKHRPEFNRMIALAKSKEHPFDTILVWKFSRFARNQEESIVYKNMLRKVNVDVVSISEPIIDGPFGALIERILEWMDEYYLINLSTEVKRGMAEKISRGEPVVPPAYGYKIVNGKYIPDEERAPVVRDVFKKYASGWGFRKISSFLNELGLTTTHGNPFDNRYIEYMLNNPVYIGKLRWSTAGRTVSRRKYNHENTLIYDGNHEPIVDVELFNTVQGRLEEQKKKYGRYQRKEGIVLWPFKGLIKCSECGATLVTVNTKSPSLQCHQYAKGKCSVSHGITQAKAKQLILDALKESIETGVFIFDEAKEQRKNNQISASDIDRLISQERSRLARVKAAYANGIDTLEEYAKNKKDIEAAIALLESEKESASKVISKKSIDKKEMKAQAMELITCIENEDIPASVRNEAMREFIEKIVFEKASGKMVVHFRL